MPSLLCLALSSAVAATLLAVLAVVVGRLCRRPAVRHSLWLLVLLKLITPPLAPLSVTWPRSEESEPPPVEIQPLSEVSEAINFRARSVSEESPLADATGCDGRLEVGEVLTVIGLGGTLAWWSVAAVRLRKFRRLLRQACPAATDVQEQGQRMAALLGLRRCPPILFVSALLSPMLWALGFSPHLLVPAELWRKLAAEQQDTLLAHELAHLRRGDHWIRRLELLVLGLYWWHPVVWWARRRRQEAEEECCDALVVAILPDAAPGYASALVETVTFLSYTRPAALVGASGAGQVPLLKRRLTMILKETSSRKPSRIGFWIVLGLGALLLPLAPQAAQTQAPEEPQRTAVDRDRAEKIENLQDDIELLKVQVRLKEARIDATKKTLEEYRRRLENYTQICQRQPGTIPTDTLMETRLHVTTHEGNLQINKTELEESQVRLKQAERRLARHQRPAEKTDSGSRAQQEKRLRELEQKVENLLKEIHKMRKEMQPDKPRDPRLQPDRLKR